MSERKIENSKNYTKIEFEKMLVNFGYHLYIVLTTSPRIPPNINFIFNKVEGMIKIEFKDLPSPTFKILFPSDKNRFCEKNDNIFNFKKNPRVAELFITDGYSKINWTNDLAVYHSNHDHYIELFRNKANTKLEFGFSSVINEILRINYVLNSRNLANGNFHRNFEIKVNNSYLNSSKYNNKNMRSWNRLDNN